MKKNIKILKSFYYPFNEEEIRLFCENKSGVYMILNEITEDSYIGRGSSDKDTHNRLYGRFKTHFYHCDRLSNKNLRKMLKYYGIQNFSFHMLEIVHHTQVAKREDFYLEKYLPEYNSILSSSSGYIHTEESRRNMRENYSLERREKIGSLNRGKNLSETTKKRISDKAKLRNSDPIFKEKHRKRCLLTNVSSKPVRVLDGTTQEFIASFPSLKFVQKYYNYKISYRHLKRFVAEKKVIKKLNIFVEYV